MQPQGSSLIKCSVRCFRPEDAVSAAKHPSFALVRDKMAAAVSSQYKTLPSDLRRFSPIRHNQLQSSSCVAQSTIRGCEVKRIKKAFDDAISSGVADAQALSLAMSKHVALSRLAVYFLARELMDPQETNQDNGTYVSLAADALKMFGACREEPMGVGDRQCWPFDLTKVNVTPSWLAMRDASVHKISKWYSITSTGDDRVNDVILALAAGNTVVYGTKVWSQWDQYVAGAPPLAPVAGPILGGHATVLEGWDPTNGVFIGENSWGPDWGVAGPDGTSGFYEMLPSVIASADSSDFVVYEEGWEEWSEAA